MAKRRMISSVLSGSRKFSKLLDVAGYLAEFCQVLYCLGIPNHDGYGQITADPWEWKTNFYRTSQRSREEFEKALDYLIKVKLFKISECKNVLLYVNYENIQTFRKDRSRINKYPDTKWQPWSTSDIPWSTSDIPWSTSDIPWSTSDIPKLIIAKHEKNTKNTNNNNNKNKIGVPWLTNVIPWLTSDIPWLTMVNQCQLKPKPKPKPKPKEKEKEKSSSDDPVNNFIDNPDLVFIKILEKIRKDERVNKESFDTWFLPLKAVSFDGKILIVRPPNGLFLNWLDEHYKKIIEENSSPITFQVMEV